jgi:hypothetical protein
MAYRRSSHVKIGATGRTATTGKGTVVKKPSASGYGSVIPPPDDGFLYMGSGPYWVGPMFFTTVGPSPPSSAPMMEMIENESGFEPITAAVASGAQKVIGWGPNVSYHPMFEGM